MACASCVLASRRDWGLADRGRSRSAAQKHMASHGPRTERAMRRERRTDDAPCGRFAFSKRPRRGPAAGQPVLLRDEPLFVGRMLGRDRRVSCRDGTLHLLLRRSLWHRGSELPPQKHSLVGRSKSALLGNKVDNNSAWTALDTTVRNSMKNVLYGKRRCELSVVIKK